MGTPKRNPYSNFPSQSFSSVKHLLIKKPRTFSFVFFTLLLLAWVSLRLHLLAPRPLEFFKTHPRWSEADDSKANLVRFKSNKGSPVVKDGRGWSLNPVSLALTSGIKGGAVSCASVHVGEIRPGGVRGNHRHYTCNETFVIWGAKTKFRVENNQTTGKGYAEVIIGEDEIAVAASSSGTAHALMNVDSFNTTFFIGCQDSEIDYDSPSTEYNIWDDL